MYIHTYKQTGSSAPVTQLLILLIINALDNKHLAELVLATWPHHFFGCGGGETLYSRISFSK